MKRPLMGAITAVLIFAGSMGAGAASLYQFRKELQEDGSLLVTATISEHTTSPSVDWEEEVLHLGSTYTLRESSETTEVIRTTPITETVSLSKEAAYAKLETEEVPETLEYDYRGTIYELPLVSVTYEPEEIPDGTTTVKGTTEFGYQIAQPQAGKTKPVQYTDTSGVSQTVQGNLTGFTMSPRKWQSGYEITARFVGDSDVKYYLLGETLIPNAGDGVPVEGYEEGILAHLGLDVDNVRIDSAKWKGRAKQEDGETVRYATLYCSQMARAYTANYSAIVENTKTVYNASALYEQPNIQVETGEVMYETATSAVYDLHQSSNLPLIIAVSAGALLVALLITGILFLMKRRKQKTQTELNFQFGLGNDL